MKAFFPVLGVYGVLATAFLTGLGLPAPARACGGFVCGTFATVPPIVQDAERIAFVDSGPDKTDVIVQVLYEGAIEDFAWVIPVPGEPEIGTSDPQLFDDLDAATAPSVFFQGPSSSGGAACAGLGASGDSAARAGAFDPGTGVEIVGTANVGPYETVTITGDDPEAVIDWLVDSGYSVPDAAIPLFVRYVSEGRYFVALRLSATADLQALEPLRLTYASDELCIPLRLTAIATAPVLAVTAWFLTPEPVVPANFDLAELATHRLQQNPDGSANYREVARESIEDAGGKAFLRQSSLDFALTSTRFFSQSVRDELLALAPDGGEGYVLTRLYTDIAAEDMDEDPVFVQDPTAPRAVSAQVLVPPANRTRCAAGPLLPGLGTLFPVAFALLLGARRRRE
ncbi:MAG: DUF2330 domain-containing protein [Myxococcota bacterium]